MLYDKHDISNTTLDDTQYFSVQEYMMNYFNGTRQYTTTDATNSREKLVHQGLEASRKKLRSSTKN